MSDPALDYYEIDVEYQHTTDEFDELETTTVSLIAPSNTKAIEWAIGSIEDHPSTQYITKAKLVTQQRVTESNMEKFE